MLWVSSSPRVFFILADALPIKGCWKPPTQRVRLPQGCSPMNSVIALPTLDDLRKHVLNMLCSKDRLEPESTPMHQAIITRRGKPCGLFFQVQGPRLLKAFAVWTGEEDRILFYDSTGARFAETKLSEGPDPLQMA